MTKQHFSAAQTGRTEIVNLLLDAKANVEIRQMRRHSIACRITERSYGNSEDAGKNGTRTDLYLIVF